ncbi:MAG: DUF433 domain-containing protein [bacterium]|nr:DUF433 domain-containing protein [bacterium]
MSTALAAEPVPLTTGEDGVIRVNGTRVTLDTLVSSFAEGATPEEIAQDYSVLNLADVYAVISYYLRHRSEVDQYLQHRDQQRAAVRRDNERRFDYRELRQRLLSRLTPDQRGRYIT